MAKVGMREMLEAGAHFGHQTRRWNPKMSKFIFGPRNGIHIIDLQQTVELFKTAYDFVVDTVGRGGKVLFVGTKKQAQDIIAEDAKRAGQYYVNNRWLGGMLTNFTTIKQSVDRLRTIETMSQDGTFAQLPKKEVIRLTRELSKLEKNLLGVKDMSKLPTAIFVIDPHRERIAIDEAIKLGLKIVATVDTNCDPDVIDFPIPANDDSLRSVKLFVSHIADACIEGGARYQEILAQRKTENPAQDMKEVQGEQEAKAARRGKQPKVEVIHTVPATPTENGKNGHAEEVPPAAEDVETDDDDIDYSAHHA